jgi:hypothetical protein
MKTLFRTTLCALALSIGAGPVLAQDEAAPAEDAAAKPDKAEKKAAKKGKRKIAKRIGACKKDVEKLCADVEPGKGALVACLAGKSAELSKGCKKVVEKAEKAHGLRDACAADVKQHCAEVKPGKGRVAKCLRGKADALSESCKARMDNAKPAKEKKAEDALADDAFPTGAADPADDAAEAEANP